ncbi:hypothetical protein CLHUN_31190 [Ruminiclostridium hungatei]|uniref:Uncharacterized protein n=1 Tax=Ruminiclostridium hungatei TaxID=48256 RepID=A0A1V4SHN0_RUMHU|nr:hypothetical protein [Ruminiclostridium hungatei]OPX42975.1 hypothetical protein CLHUN_31190 [Ruminiclostridium hungatei]
MGRKIEYSDEDLIPHGDGELPSNINIPNKAMWIGIVFNLLPSLFCLFLALYFSFATILDKNMVWDFSNRLPGIIIFGILALLGFWITYRYFKRDITIKKELRKNRN